MLKYSWPLRTHSEGTAIYLHQGCIGVSRQKETNHFGMALALHHSHLLAYRLPSSCHPQPLPFARWVYDWVRKPPNKQWLVNETTVSGHRGETLDFVGSLCF